MFYVFLPDIVKTFLTRKMLFLNAVIVSIILQGAHTAREVAHGTAAGVGGYMIGRNIEDKHDH